MPGSGKPAALATALEGGFRLGVVLAPAVIGDEHAPADHPRADHHQRQTDIECPVGEHGRIEGVEYGGHIGQQRVRCQQQTGQHHPEGGPLQPQVAVGAIQAVGEGIGEKATDKESRPYQGIEHAVEGQPLIIGLDDRLQIAVKVKTGVFQPLQDAEGQANGQGQDTNDQVGAGDAVDGLEMIVRKNGSLLARVQFAGGHGLYRHGWELLG
jgi:hypothetical protein